ncbi:hypothetical protein ACFXC8_45030 [Streptomyces sp. NPDC059441]|uniref:hypothetical protein n=1 Tax=Streptomyces sp. NPDC059441 TaxID=3346829 RepID=UPI0036CF45DF
MTGYTRERLMQLARQNDDGFDPQMFADSLASSALPTSSSPPTPLPPPKPQPLLERFADWQHQLIVPGNANPAGT